MRSYKPDIIIIDVRLGNNDGRLICRQLREESESSSKIILQSALTEFGAAYEEHAADDFMQKPFTVDQLISKINGHLKK